MVWLSVICSVLLLLTAFLVVKIFLMKRDIEKIDREFTEKLKADTNALITLNGRDRSVCRLTSNINKQLKILRKQRLRYEQGDLELKNAVANISHDFGYIRLLGFA